LSNDRLMDKELEQQLKEFCEQYDEATENQDKQRFSDAANTLRDFLDEHGFPRPSEPDDEELKKLFF